MPASFSVLIGFQLLGEVVHRVLHLPLPGPVIGMFLLAGTLIYRRGCANAATMDAMTNRASSTPLSHTANSLIHHMGLLFVPAGVGIMTQGAMLRHQWLPIIVGILGSTLLSLGVTGLVFHHLSRAGQRSLSKRPEATAPAARPS